MRNELRLVHAENREGVFLLTNQEEPKQRRSTANGRLHFTDPLAIFPDSAERGEIATVENVAGGSEEFSLFHIVISVAGADGHELENARITIAIDHATGAAVANQLGFVEVVDAAHWRLPVMAAIQLQIPIEIEIFMAAEASEFFRLFAEMTLHLTE